jgi:hypothetical protein
MSTVAVIIGLLIFESQVTTTWAQAEQEQGYTWCESPRERSKSLIDTQKKKSLGFRGEEPGGDNFRGLDPLPKPRSNDDSPMGDPKVKPSQPPINGVRDYLNRQDPAHAINPIGPESPGLSP